MKVIYNNWFPFGNFTAINICGILFVKGDSVSEKTLNHEAIHTAQMKETLYVGFYLWYFFEWLYQAIVWLFNREIKAYYFITMEQEAYDNEDKIDYLNGRTPYAWWKYIGQWIKY